MPTVQKLQRTVTPEAMPGARLTAADTPLSLGAGIEQAKANRDESIGKLGEVGTSIGLQGYAAIKKQQREQADQVAFLAAGNRLAEWEKNRLYDPQKGAFTLKGQSSFTLPETIDNEFEQVTAAIEQGLGTNEQRLAFAKLKAQRSDEIGLSVRRYVAGEMRTYDAGEVNARLSTAHDLAVANAMDPHAAMGWITNGVNTIKEAAPRLGLGPEATQAQVDKFTSDGHVGIIGRLLDNDQAKSAGIYYDETKDQIAGHERGALEKALEEGSTRKQAQEATDAIMAGTFGLRADGSQKGGGFLGPLANAEKPGAFSSELSIGVEIDGKETEIPSLVPTLTAEEVKSVLALKDGEPMPKAVVEKATAFAKQRIAAGKSPFAGPGEAVKPPAGVENAPAPKPQPPQTLTEARTMAKSIEDPRLRDEVMTKIEHEFAVRAESDRQAEEQRALDGAHIVDVFHDVSKIPAATWASYSLSTMSALRSYSAALTKNGDVETDWPTYYSLMTQAGEDPTKFAKLNLIDHIHDLGRVEFKQLTEMQLAMRKDSKTPAQLAGFRSQQEIADTTLVQYGIDPAKAKPGAGYDAVIANQVAQFYRSLGAAVDVMQAGGKKASDTDVQSQADRILSRMITVPGTNGFFSRSADVKHRLIETTIDQISASDRKMIEAALKAKGRPVSDQTILDLYIQTKSAPGR